jgi:two-component system, OmpR family, alkaline phosphatase synthesis response regulator PhoP
MSGSVTILVVDDERALVELIARYLEREGFRVLRAYDGLAAVELARVEQPDLIVLDIMLPGIDGLEVCRRIRAMSDAYVLMLTARTEEIDRVIGLTAGADDYVTKPFSPHELVARVRAMLRRPRAIASSDAEPREPQRVVAGPLVVDFDAHEIFIDGHPVALTPNEFSVLAALAEHPGHVLTRGQLLDRVWGPDFYGDEHVVDVHISNVRRKLGATGRTDLIETIRGVGYRFRRLGR